MRDKFKGISIILGAYGVPGIIAIETLFSIGFHSSDIGLFTHEKDVRNLPLWNYAELNGIDVVQFPATSDELFRWAQKKNPAVIFSFHYRERIPARLIWLCRYGGVNLHPSLLPDYKGCFSIPWTIINGEKKTGYTYHYMTEEFDQGNIIHQRSIVIKSDDTAFSLFHRLILEGLKSFEIVFKKVVFDQVQGQKQHGNGSYYARMVPFGGYIDHSWDDRRVERFIRAMVFPPHKGALLRINGIDHEVKALREYLTICGRAGIR